ncbi:MAG TPA: CoB--CoM heterodisulfide reductase iron-sulfur subunit A family protein [Actinobacteria bacterium]|nr:CoB--CoM heterodisulfide reductase iron-sulfur subunit A family protein [Actinomycetota bacterium]
MSSRVVVIGGGPGGLEAARLAADLGQPVLVVEKRESLGGMPISANYAALTHGMQSAEELSNLLIQGATSRPNVEVRANSEVTAVDGAAGAFSVTISSNGADDTVEAGAIVVATGFQHFDPGRETQQYGYYEFPDVLALQDAERMLKENNFVTPSTGKPPERVAFIQCVGSRDRQIGNEYCSKVCCGISSKQAIEVRQQVPDSRVFIFYIDMRMYGYWENEIYWPAQEQHRVNYVKGIVTEILSKNGRLLIRGEDTTMGRPMEIPMDVVVLAVGMEPSQGTRQMAEILGIPSNQYGFIETVHDSLDTVTTTVPGVFACGAATGPADLDDTISSAGAAAAKAVAFLRSAVGTPA